MRNKTTGETGGEQKGPPNGSLSGALDGETESLMEKILATCLSLPRQDMDSAIEEACSEHPHLAPYLRHRYLSLLQMGILEYHEEDGIQGEMAQ